MYKLPLNTTLKKEDLLTLLPGEEDSLKLLIEDNHILVVVTHKSEKNPLEVELREAAVKQAEEAYKQSQPTHIKFIEGQVINPSWPGIMWPK